MYKALAILLIIGVFAVAAFGLWLMACSHGYFTEYCRVTSVFCGSGTCPSDANEFISAAFHLNVFRNISAAVLLLGLLGAALFIGLWIEVLSLKQKLEFARATSGQAGPSQRRLVHWYAILEKRDPTR